MPCNQFRGKTDLSSNTNTNTSTNTNIDTNTNTNKNTDTILKGVSQSVVVLYG